MRGELELYDGGPLHVIELIGLEPMAVDLLDGDAQRRR